MPTTLSQAITTDGILEAFTTALVFINNNFDDNWTLASTTTRSSSSTTSFIHNPFGHHHNNTSSSSDGGMFKLTTWRRKIEGEVIDPYRITCKAQGIDPLTLATIWQDIPHFRTAHHIGIDSAEDITTDAITKASHHHHDCMDSIKMYIVHMKGYGTMRKREAVIISIMKEISASKVAVLEYSIPPITGNDDDVLSNYTPDKSSVHITTTFNVALFENDAGANTKVTIAGLVPVGGKTEKLKLSIMAEREVKAQQKLMTLMYNYFTDTSEGRSLVINTRTTILGKVWKPLLSDSSIALSKLQLQFLKANSDTFNMLCNEEDHINTNSSDK
ncbi:hypothetical protein Pmar_PMAR022140 [Perkinsus marinus ATCC 50983]|uniref:Uncharacterized protein n=1 Tax=Perkinsus marinus (strain ATCC 50983 / TXsc) TaxID=423536 RepID=C5L0Q1_PERM5|nr:hypothetical protein Pmar_PMAR022140 [Perkinsus marinus ATCC 50983]EER09703.1 hypothetical protein Pmar_PMAR022140 [Perkinsus marinus ATCC 50983]|eukprot:XP_002777908.1 hypothetical protein Pmar_PMAR022140 [Perkinsus marinus ATCC 50983]